MRRPVVKAVEADGPYCSAVRMVQPCLLSFIGLLVFGQILAGKVLAANGLVPGPFVSAATGERLLLVDKSRHRLYVFDDSFNPIRSFRVTTGKRAGDKLERGDLKTPEGVYFFTGVIDGRELPPKYGVMALVTDYPNPIDRLAGKTGSGIWLHATDDPSRIQRPRDTRGCVVATDEDVLEIAGYVDLGRTPLVVVKELDYHSREDAEALKKAVVGFMERAGLLGDRKGGGGVTVLRHKEAFVVSAAGRITYLLRDADGFRVAGKRRYEPGDDLKGMIERLAERLTKGPRR